MSRTPESQAGLWALVLLVVTAVVIAMLWASCATVHPTAQRPCDPGPAPRAAHFATTRAGCPSGLTCFAAGDLTALLDELEERRGFDARVAACARYPSRRR